MGLSAPQKEIANCKARFRVAICGRRFGKTHLAIRELSRFATVPNSEIFYVAPTIKQSRNIVWKKLKNKLQSLNWVKRTNETHLSITLHNGSTITLKGAESSDSLRGVGLNFIVLDEFADFKDKSAWYEVLRPTLADTEGHALFIGTPKGKGNWAHDIYNMYRENADWKSFQFTTIQGGNVSALEIMAARRDLDERTFRQEFEATFESYEGSIYYAFNSDANVYSLKDDVYCNQTLHLGMDFNVNPMSAVVTRIDGDVIKVVDEIRIFGSNTDEMVQEIKNRYSQCKIIVYPDPAGSQNKSSAGGKTDHTILANAGFIVKAPRKHTPVRDRINAVNARLSSANGNHHLFIADRCKHTIECLERQVYKEGTSIPDKGVYDHMNDALGYLVDYLFPIRKDHEPITPQRWGHNL